jgi:hypothetical protein
LNDKRQPAVIFTDFNVARKYARPGRFLAPDPYFTPHYSLVAGLKDTSGYREFYVYDPWYDHRAFWVTEQQLKDMMFVPPEMYHHNQPYLVWLGSCTTEVIGMEAVTTDW